MPIFGFSLKVRETKARIERNREGKEGKVDPGREGAVTGGFAQKTYRATGDPAGWLPLPESPLNHHGVKNRAFVCCWRV
ncbi:hypothetical protein Ddc_14286 [Ditylenchus destructor]|nr:hypothetical protein Ddc_14286 [Ditylenchus destructor]